MPCVLQAGIIVAVVAWHAADVINVTVMPLHAAGGHHCCQCTTVAVSLYLCMVKQVVDAGIIIDDPWLQWLYIIITSSL